MFQNQWKQDTNTDCKLCRQLCNVWLPSIKYLVGLLNHASSHDHDHDQIKINIKIITFIGEIHVYFGKGIFYKTFVLQLIRKDRSYYLISLATSCNSVLFSVTVFCRWFCWFWPYRAVLCYVVQCCTVLCSFVLFWACLCCVIMCCVLLYCAMLCCVV